MKSSAASMGQIRGMVYIRFHIAVLNRDWIQAGKLLACPDALDKLSCSAIVFDGVRVGINGKLFCPQRPYELPHDNPQHDQVRPSDLPDGVHLKDRAMLPDVRIRRLVLELLSSKKGLSESDADSLQEWIGEHRGEMEPFLSLQVKNGDRWHFRSDARQTSLRPLWTHWASGAPELVVMPVMVLPHVTAIVSGPASVVSVPDAHHISQVAPGIFAVMTLPPHSSDALPDDSPEVLPEGQSTSLQLHRPVVELLKSMLKCALACLQVTDQLPIRTLPWESGHGDFEEMVRTASYFPQFPVLRQLPEFRQDYHNRMDASRRSSAKTQANDDCTDELRDRSVNMGLTCNKYKDRQGSITPGLFTFFCAKCGICLGFELFDSVESPSSAFKVFALRAWTKGDVLTMDRHKDDGVWVDEATELPSALKLQSLDAHEEASLEADQSMH